MQTGFRAATKELIFYTDGDAQYDPAELAALWARMTPRIDMVNGYKISRKDPINRNIIGRLYHHFVSLMFGLKVRDVDCDFRLMRRAIFERIDLSKTSGVICVEMMKKIEDAGFQIVEVPVHRSTARSGNRSSSTSAGSPGPASTSSAWYTLVVRREHRRAGVRPLASAAEAANRAGYPSAPRT